MIREDVRTDLGQTVHTEGNQGMDKTIEVGQDMILIIEVVTDTIQEVIKGMGDRIIITAEGEALEIKITIGIEVGHTKDRIDRRNGRSVSNSRSRSGSRATTNRDRIRCFECREYNHFARDCLTMQANREAEQIQQMFNMDEDQTILQTY